MENENITERIEKLEQEIKNLKDFSLVTNDTEGALRERLGDIQPSENIAVADLRRKITVSIGGGSDSFFVLDYPDGFIQIKIQGKIRKIPYYND